MRTASGPVFRRTTRATPSGFTYQLSPSIMIRPEVGYYHSYNAKAFDLGKKDYTVIGGLDVTLRF